MTVAVGFVAKTGSAIAVALRISPEAEIVDKRTLVLAPEGVERFVYHAAVDLGADAAKYVRDSTRKIEKAAAKEVAAFVRATGATVAGIVGNSLEMPGTLDAILATHPKLHSAEGVLYRAAIADALAVQGITAALVGKGDLGGNEWVLDALGKVPSPWRKEHKDATLAAASVL